MIEKRVYEYLILLQNEPGEILNTGGQYEVQDGPDIIGFWSDSGSGYDEFPNGNLINSY